LEKFTAAGNQVMANQIAARLGVLLGIDTAEFSSGVDKAVSETRKLKRSIESEMKNAEKEIQRIKYAVEDYGKEVSAVTLMQRQLAEGGRYANLAKSSDSFAKAMLKEAAALDAVVASQKKLNGSRSSKEMGLDRFQKQALAYQTTDIVTSLAGGQNPFMVLLQQGGQLRDQFGGFKELFSAISQVVTFSRVAFVGLAGALGIVGVAAYKGAAELAKLRDDLILTNNYAGITASGFVKLSRSLADDLKISIGDAKTIFGSLVASGKITQANLDSVATAIGMVAKLSDESADAVMQRLLPAFDGTASSAKRLNEQYNFLNLTQYKHIEQLNRQGKLQEAAKFTADALTASLQGQKREVGALESAFSKISKTASELWNTLKQIGMPSTLQDAVDNTRKAMLSAADSLSGPMSPLAKANAERRFEQAREAYLAASGKLRADVERVEKESAKKAAEQAKIDNWTKAGGAEKAASYVAEYQKLKADEVFQREMFNATRFEQIRLESAKRVKEKELELARASGQEMGQFSGQQKNILNQFKINEELKVAQEIQKINREAFKQENNRQITEKNSLDMEKQKMGIYQSNFFLTAAEAKLAEQRLETQQEIAKILAKEDLTDDAKRKLVEQQEAIGKTKEEIISLSDKLQYVKDVNQAVFSSMTMAIEAFVLTGKFSMENFVKSILASFVKIQAQWMALSMMRGLGSIFGGMSAGPQPLGMYGGAGFGSPMAAGGFTSGGMPHLVGENGPELFVPQGAGTIVPNQQMSSYGSGQSQNVFNGPYIASMNAIDTQSGIQFLAKNKMTIWSMNQSANRSIPAGR
jgi:phage-related minor tail protein